MRIISAGLGLRAGHVLSILCEAMPEAELVGFYDPEPDHVLDRDGATISDAEVAGLVGDQVFPGYPDATKITQLRQSFLACAALRRRTPRFDNLEDMLAQSDADLF